MTPKQKAISLCNRYVNLLPTGSNVERAKQCAVIAVDEIIGYGYKPEFPYKYWEEVKQEIESL